ncbi:hypothetical protein DY000_02002671 [Brassica cretica]|uniref:Uncharacterized protein n=1 Tax=Brassica cretica TaxID=69181 RepID=A0ABQ7C8M2_BRACR|nr:hypothetical protein DY000_02002671 [Brassica cretica]
METSAVLTCSSSMATSAKTACNVKKGGELIMLLLDSKATLLAASSPSHHLQTSLDGSLEEHFRFRNHSQLLGLANTNTQLPDIIAETVTIAELNEWLNLSAPGTGFNMDKGWCYVSNSRCTKKFQRMVSSFTCATFNNTTPLVSFGWRGRESRAHTATPFIAQMAGKTYTFQARATASLAMASSDLRRPPKRLRTPMLSEEQVDVHLLQERNKRRCFTSETPLNWRQHKRDQVSNLSRACEPKQKANSNKRKKRGPLDRYIVF